MLPMLSKSTACLWLSFIVLCSFCANATREVSQIHQSIGDGNWSLGAGFRFSTFPYKGDDVDVDFLPLLTYNGKRYFIDGTRAGYHLINTDKWLISTYAAYRFGGFNEEDSDYLIGMEREDGVDGRFATTYRNDFGRFTIDLGADISGHSNGWDAQFRWGEIYSFGNYSVRPWIAVTYQDQSLTDYYYGVREDEQTLFRPAYITNSSVEFSYGIDTTYEFSHHHFIGLNVKYSELDDTKLHSPIVDENGLFSAFVNYRYEFNDFQQDPYTNGSIFKDLTQGEWYWRFAAGRTTTADFAGLMQFQDMFDPEKRNTGLASIFLGKRIADKFMGLPLDVYLTGGYLRRFERGEQSDFNEYAIGVKAYFSKFPWSDKVKTRIGFAEGISYAEKIPIVEKENVEGKNRSASHFLNYLDWSIDVSIGDVFNSKQLKDCFFGWSVHHRSGIFASSDFFGNVDGGGNINTLYIQCHNTG